MERAIIVALGLALVAVWAPGVVGHHGTTSFDGTIVVGTSDTGFRGCADVPTSGSTSDTWDVRGFEGHAFQLEMDATLDANLYFYDEACDGLSYYGGTSGGIGETEVGIVPDTARWIGVWGDEGSGSYNLTLGGEGPDLVPRTESRFYVGGGGYTLNTEAFSGVDEVPLVGVTNYGGAMFPIHGVESTVSIEMVEVNADGFYRYEFRDLQNDVVSAGCIEENAGITTVDVPAGSSRLLLFAGPLYGCGDAFEDPFGAAFKLSAVGYFEVTFQ